MQLGAHHLPRYVIIGIRERFAGATLDLQGPGLLNVPLGERQIHRVLW